MMKKTARFLLGLSLMVPLTSCGSFFGEEESLIIETIKTETLENGDTKVTITYSNEDKNPDTFIVPKGDQGEDGNGIKSVTSTVLEDGSTKIDVTFTDKSQSPVSLTIPRGISITGIESLEEDGEVFMVVCYSDGSKSEPIHLLRGPEGNGITGYENVKNEDGSTTITFHFSAMDDVVITIPAPEKGEAGKGISSIISRTDSDESKYYLDITYTDGTTETLSFDAPSEPNTWLSGTGKPLNNTGNNGDYYFDLANKTIYFKNGRQWTMIVNFGDLVDEKITVTFNLNANGDTSARMNYNADLTYEIAKQSTFLDNGIAIPTASRDSYDFGGWYTAAVITPTTGKLDDLTILSSDITFYASWISR